MPAPITLLAKSLPVVVAPGADAASDKVWSVIKAAADLLNAQQAQLNATMLQYIGALQGFGIASERSFTPLPDTADAELGVYVFFVGVADVDINDDAHWYASTIIHDGGHSWLSQHNEVAIGIDVEEALTQVQIDYYGIVGDPANYTSSLQNYEHNTVAIQNRINQPVGDAPAADV